MSRVKEFFFNKRWEIISFFVLLTICIVYCIGKNADMEIGDTSYYVTIADDVISSDGFNLMAFPETFRGYFFAVYLQILKHSFLGLEWGWKISASFMLAALFSFILPGIIGKKIDSVNKLIGAVAGLCIYLYVWHDTPLFPLSDLPTVFTLAFLVYLLGYLCDNADCKHSVVVVVSLLAGILAYITYNTRVVFLYGIVIVICKYLVIMRKNVKRLFLSAVFMTLGAILVMIPQCMINQKYTGSFTPRIFTEQLYGYSRNLQMQQIFWGMKYPRYETYVGDLDDFPANAVFYKDEAGIMLLEREHITEDNLTIKTWVYLAFKYPLDFVGIYTRHFINIMTPVYRNSYIYDFYTNKWFIILISVLIWLVIGLKFLVHPEKLSVRHVDLMAITLPAVLQAAGAPEIRFFLPVYLLSYSYIGVGINYIDLFNCLKKKWFRYAVVSIIVLFAWLAVIGDTLADCRNTVTLINDVDNAYMLEDK